MQFILFSLRFVFQQKFPFFLLFVFLLVIFLDFLKMAKRRWDGVFGGVVEGSRNNFRLFTFVFPYFLLFFLSLRSSASIIFIFVYFVAKFPELFLLLWLIIVIRYSRFCCCNCGNTHYLYLYAYFIVYSCKLQ